MVYEKVRGSVYVAGDAEPAQGGICVLASGHPVRSRGRDACVGAPKRPARQRGPPRSTTARFSSARLGSDWRGGPTAPEVVGLQYA